MKNNVKILTLAAMLLSLLFVSCTTTIPVRIQRPAELDLNGAKTISVLPFQVTENTSVIQNTVIVNMINLINTLDLDNTRNESNQIASYITRGLTQSLTSSDYFDFISADAVQAALNNGKKAPCDVYLTGYVSDYSNEVKSKNTTKYINNVKTAVTVWYRVVSFSLTYQVIDSSTNKVISYKTVDICRESSEEEKEYYVTDAFNLIDDDLEDIVYSIMKQLQPYTVVKYIELLNDKTKDPDMEQAHDLAKNGLIDASRDLFRFLYENRGYFEAGYNAAILLEAQGNYQQAYDEMEELYVRTHEQKALSAMLDIKAELESQKALAHQLSK